MMMQAEEKLDSSEKPEKIGGVFFSTNARIFILKNILN